MDWWTLITWIGTPAGATAIVGWLLRRRIGRYPNRLGNFLNAQRNLLSCEAERTKQAESFARQEAGLMREIQQRERERDSLAAALKQLSEAVEVVREARSVGVLTPSLNDPGVLPASSSPGLTRRRVKRTAARLARPRGPPTGRSNDHETPS